MSQNEDSRDADRLDAALGQLRASSEDLLLAGLRRAARTAVEQELERLAGTPATLGLTSADFEVQVTRMPMA